jgi:hypothetical protein
LVFIYLQDPIVVGLSVTSWRRLFAGSIVVSLSHSGVAGDEACALI